MASDPAYLRAFKEYTKTLPDIDEREAMEKEFYGVSDRACGILFSSWVELMIERAIKNRRLYRISLKLFDYDGPLGTFSAKIMMAYALGLFGSKTNHDLLLIRTLRNEFAHCQKAIRFDIPVVKAVCDHLILPDIDKIRAIPVDLIERSPKPGSTWYDHDHPKTRFAIACYTIITGLFNLTLQQPESPLRSSHLP